MDNQLSADEFSNLVKELNRPMSFENADKDDNKSVTVEELFEYLESGGPMLRSSPTDAPSSAASSNPRLEWAKRTINKYDLNGDGQLTANEWEQMIIKPTAADANHDGIITAEEYAAFREK